MKIVIVSDPGRQDFYNYLVDNLSPDHELYILWHYSKQGFVTPAYGNCSFLYWKDYFSPRELLNKIKPDRILFFEIIDFWQIPLIITSHHFKMTTFFIEHGVGNSVNTVISRFQELPSVKKRIIYYVKKLMFKFFRVYRNRMFFLSAAKYLDKSDRSKYIKLFFYYKKFTPIHALSLLKFRERTPHFAILFNRNNIEPFLLYNEIEQSNVFTLGVPFYDKYVRRETVQKSHIVFIEHPYLESHLLDWDDAFHENVARTIENFAIKKQIKIIVKLHPSSDIQNWLRYNLDPLVVIKQREDVTDEMLNARLILGYSSTLINVLIAAKKNVVLLGWHPEPKIFGDDVSRTGLCHVSFEASELIARYDYWIANNLAINNTTALEEFIEEYNHPFDGKATKRVIDTILQNEVS